MLHLNKITLTQFKNYPSASFEFTKRVRKEGRYKIFKKGALISARKYYTNSWWRVQMANKKIVSMYKKGASQQEMADKYKEMLNYR